MRDRSLRTFPKFTRTGTGPCPRDQSLETGPPMRDRSPRAPQPNTLTGTAGSQFRSYVPGAQKWVRKFYIVNIVYFDAWQGGRQWDFGPEIDHPSVVAGFGAILGGLVAGLEVLPAVLLVIRDHLAARNCIREPSSSAAAIAGQDRGKGVAS
uniref:Uncharacterized protein n=1 Tax=Ananas comosus var. bracteatus TaxID=296719 RepID=A0A6V7QH31_ANACO|nr:unnamed protein product [Ananas comosus var. bracteatus]